MDMKFTVAYVRTSVLSLCYSDAELEALVTRANAEGPLAVLLSIPAHDAIRGCAGLMTRPQLIEWSAFAARRAKEYAARATASAAYAASADSADAAAYAAAASSAAYDASYAAASYAASYAASAASAAAYAAAAHARGKDLALSIRDACRLLGWA